MHRFETQHFQFGDEREFTDKPLESVASDDTNFIETTYEAIVLVGNPTPNADQLSRRIVPTRFPARTFNSSF